MLASNLRLKGAYNFSRVRREGKSWRAKVVITGVVRNDLPHCRFGFVVSKRVGNAVIRNRVRRRLRASVSAELTLITPGYDVVIVAQPAAADASYSEIASDVQRCLSFLGLMNVRKTPDGPLQVVQ